MKRRALVVAVAVAAILLVLFVLAVPLIRQARRGAQRNVCLVHLRQITGAKASWAMAENQPADAMPSWADLDPYFYGGTNAMVCPLDPNGSCVTSYEIGRLGRLPRCKIMPHEHAFPKRARVVGMLIVVDEEE
ncbi:MAG: prepilin-type cleavage/methylation domain-containing protein [Kiritimatiellae bacterium]|nr:prepilin-type cleavage/methylation domain-containing protein [Kiritimatiellia bacterium]